MTKLSNSALADSAIHASGRREYYPLRPIDVLAVGAFWTLLAFISAASRGLDPRVPGIPDPIVSAVVTATYAEYALWAVITVPLLYLTSRYSIEGGRRFGRLALFLLGGLAIAIAMDTLLSLLRDDLLAPLINLPRREELPVVGLGVLDDLMVYFAVVGAGVARDFFLRYRARLEEASQLQAQLAQARLDVLRSQLNPHFLFNTLNAVSALVERDPRGARRMIARLSDLLRYTLEERTDQEVPLHRELDLLGEYVELMRIRFGGNLDVVFDVADDARDALVPNLLLQPIVENAIKHGVSRVEHPGRIEVRARRENGHLRLVVGDNGPGPGGGPHGVGLRNTNARLRALYGPGFRVSLQANGEGGTAAEVTLPYHTAPLYAEDA